MRFPGESCSVVAVKVLCIMQKVSVKLKSVKHTRSCRVIEPWPAQATDSLLRTVEHNIWMHQRVCSPRRCGSQSCEPSRSAWAESWWTETQGHVFVYTTAIVHTAHIPRSGKAIWYLPDALIQSDSQLSYFIQMSSCRVTGLAQRTSRGSLVILGYELAAFWSTRKSTELHHHVDFVHPFF